MSEREKEQVKIEGFSRLLIEEHKQLKKYSGAWISKDRHWLIIPHEFLRLRHRLVPITRYATALYEEYGNNFSLAQELSILIDNYKKMVQRFENRKAEQVS